MIKKKISVRKLGNSDLISDYDIATVWVHGTGQNPLLHKFHTSPLGLKSLAEIPTGYGLKNVGEALHTHDADGFHRDNFYTFGWSGTLSFAARELAAKELNDALRELQEMHQLKHGKKPLIRVVSHSHGCNVVLNASDSLLLGEDPVTVDELVLLACPVQTATSAKISSAAFKNIYSLYSTRDLIQILDPQGFNSEGVDAGGKWFSERRFPHQANLTQAQIRWKGLGLTHAGFVRERFGKALPSILATLRDAKNAPDKPLEAHEYIIDIMKYEK